MANCVRPAGGERAAVLDSLVASCRRIEVQPFAHLRGVIQCVTAHPIGRFGNSHREGSGRWVRPTSPVHRQLTIAGTSEDAAHTPGLVEFGQVDGNGLQL